MDLPLHIMGNGCIALVFRGKQPCTEICTGRISLKHLLPAIAVLRHSKIDLVHPRRLVRLEVEKDEILAGVLRGHRSQTASMV